MLRSAGVGVVRGLVGIQAPVDLLGQQVELVERCHQLDGDIMLRHEMQAIGLPLRDDLKTDE